MTNPSLHPPARSGEQDDTEQRVSDLLERYYEHFGDPGSEAGRRAHEYHQRHETASACILTVYDDEKARAITDYLEPRIAGKVVVEIGAGIGLLACHLATVARKVYAIEADPAWTSVFLATMYERKPPNLTFIFGRAEDAPPIVADVALFCTLSGQCAMYHAASLFAPVVIDVYEEIVPTHKRKEILLRDGWLGDAIEELQHA